MKTQFSAEASLDRDKFTASLRPITMDRIRGKSGDILHSIDRNLSLGHCRTAVPKEEIKIGCISVPAAGLLRFEIARLEARYDSGARRSTSPKFTTTQLRRRD
jgi:hypothetical protein